MFPFIYNQQLLRKGLARMVTSMELPLTFGEDPKFLHFMHMYAQPAYHWILRTNWSNVVKSYKNEKHLIIEEFKNHSGIVFVTSYIWTNQSNDPFTCVTLYRFKLEITKENIRFLSNISSSWWVYHIWFFDKCF